MCKCDIIKEESGTAIVEHTMILSLTMIVFLVSLRPIGHHVVEVFANVAHELNNTNTNNSDNNKISIT